jgi:hypothetical protein
MLDEIDVAKARATKFAVACGKLSKIVGAYGNPAATGHNLPMFLGVATFAECLALVVLVFPRATPRDVFPVVNL